MIAETWVVEGNELVTKYTAIWTKKNLTQSASFD